jgi:hypothetical protein
MFLSSCACFPLAIILNHVYVDISQVIVGW